MSAFNQFQSWLFGHRASLARVQPEPAALAPRNETRQAPSTPVSACRTTTNPWDVLDRVRIYYRDPRGNGARFPVRLGDWITTRAGNEARIVEVIGRPVQALIAPDRRTGEPRILHAHSPNGYAAPSHFVVELS